MNGNSSLVNDLEQLQGAPLEEEDILDLEAFARGQELRAIVSTPGFEIIVNAYKSYEEKAIGLLLSIPPGDTDRVMAAHAAASAIAQVNANFKMDVQSAIESANQIPEVLKRGLRPE